MNGSWYYGLVLCSSNLAVLCFLPLWSSNNTSIILSKMQQMPLGCAGKGNWEIWQFQWQVDVWLTIPLKRILRCSLPASKVSPDALPLTSRSSYNTQQTCNPSNRASSLRPLMPPTRGWNTDVPSPSTFWNSVLVSLLSGKFSVPPQCPHTTHVST